MRKLGTSKGAPWTAIILRAALQANALLEGEEFTELVRQLRARARATQPGPAQEKQLAELSHQPDHAHQQYEVFKGSGPVDRVPLEALMDGVPGPDPRRTQAPGTSGGTRRWKE